MLLFSESAIHKNVVLKLELLLFSLTKFFGFWRTILKQDMVKIFRPCPIQFSIATDHLRKAASWSGCSCSPFQIVPSCALAIENKITRTECFRSNKTLDQVKFDEWIPKKKEHNIFGPFWNIISVMISVFCSTFWDFLKQFLMHTQKFTNEDYLSGLNFSCKSKHLENFYFAAKRNAVCASKHGNRH